MRVVIHSHPRVCNGGLSHHVEEAAPHSLLNHCVEHHEYVSYSGTVAMCATDSVLCSSFTHI